MMTDWASTNRQTARVTLAEGLVIHGDVPLQPRVAWRDGPETPVELLNRIEAFFPLSLPHGEVVFVADAQRAVQRKVEVGLASDTTVEIVSGLREGDRVITQGQETLQDGARIVDDGA